MTHSLFFYGTLCVPEVLHRVLGRDLGQLEISDAVLHDHVRLHVAGQDYPALVTLQEAEKIQGYEPSNEVRPSVQGVLVKGLTDSDLAFLDEFEGDEYSQSNCCPVDWENPAKSYPDTVFFHYVAPLDRLSSKPWTLTDFLRDASHRWVGENSQEYREVDQKRQQHRSGEPSSTRSSLVSAGPPQTKKPVEEEEQDWQDFRTTTGEKFGRDVAEKYWGFERDWINLNHGSYGAAPTPVVNSFLSIRETVDRAPDRFMRIEYESKLVELRQQLADLVDCDTDDLVVVPSATMGVNCALQAMTNEWKDGDRLLYFDTTIYQACKQTLQHVVDSHQHLRLSLLPVTFTYPIAHAKVIDLTRRAIEEAEKDGTTKVRLALIDGISSNPGVIVPWEKLVELFQEKNVVSLVDAAHNIGQLPVSLRTTNPDFWISNCHKWLLAHRGCAVLHVNKRFQHLVHSVPISHFYSVRTPETASKWIDEFVWTGTLDWSPILSTLEALKFRHDVLGGEEKITKYCHNLALEGGERVAEILGTRTMRNRDPLTMGELVPNMINVLLPLPSQLPFGSGPPLEGGDPLKRYWYKTLVEEFHTAVPIFPHDELPWVRLSAQVYNDLDDFERVGRALRQVCQRIEQGYHLHLGDE